VIEGGARFLRCEFSRDLLSVMAGRSRSKNGVASAAYVPAIYVFLA
jgi:hypothetical protein